MYLSGIRLDLSPEDKVIKRELAECLPRAYSELIRSDIPGSSGSRSIRPATLRPSPPSVMKFSHDGPPVVKPTKGELLARVETLSWRSRSLKRKTLASPEKGCPSWVKSRSWGRLLPHLIPMPECWGKCCRPRPRFLEPQVRSFALILLQRPKASREGPLSLRWRSCLSPFGVPLHRAQSLLLRGRKS